MLRRLAAGAPWLVGAAHGACAPQATAASACCSGTGQGWAWERLLHTAVRSSDRGSGSGSGSGGGSGGGGVTSSSSSCCCSSSVPHPSWQQQRRQQHSGAGEAAAAAAAAAVAAPPRSNAPLADPWTPTSQLVKRKTYQKRCRHLIQVLEREQAEALGAPKQLPPFRAGDVLEVTTVVPEADRKVFAYRGVCIARANKGPRSWFKIYNVFPDVGGFVQHFPLFMPDLVSVRVVGRLPRARRSRLYDLLQDEGPKHVYQTAVSPPR